jgi:molybdopterin/thiamine biosynthesis adenylyltransferase
VIIHFVALSVCIEYFVADLTLVSIFFSVQSDRAHDQSWTSITLPDFQNPYIATTGKGVMNRYSRQILLSQIGEEGQETLKKSKVTIVGCGALGSSIAEHLTRAGVGEILVVDRDFVELDNLQRQHLFSEFDVGRPKAITAEEKLREINSQIHIKGVVEDINQTNVEKFIKERDIILDGTDNLDVRYLLNDACIKNGIPWIYGACVSVHGMSMNVLPGGPCLRCLLPQMPPPGSVPTCDTIGILNTVPSVIGSIESTETIRFLVEGTIDSHLTIVDLWEQDFRRVSVSQRKNCPCCVNRKYEFLDSPHEMVTMVGRDSVQVNPLVGSVSLNDLAQKLRSRGDVEETPYVLFFSVNQVSFSVFPDGRAIIKGIDDKEKARSLYAEFIGN